MTARSTGPVLTGQAGPMGAGAILAAAALWGTVGPAQVLASSSADPGALGVARLLLGGMALALFCRRRAAWLRAVRRDVIGWVLLAALATGVYQVTFMHAVDQLGAALGTAVALGVAPVATGLCSRWWTREKLTLGWTVGTVAAVIGCVVLLDPWGSVPSNFSGVGIALASGTCYGVYTVAAKRYIQAGVPSLPATALTLLIAGIALSPLLIMNSESLGDTNSLALIAWIGIPGTAAAYAAFVYGLRRTTAPTAGTLSLAEPLLAAALGVFVLREHLPASALLGCLVLVAGLALVTVVDSTRLVNVGLPHRWSQRAPGTGSRRVEAAGWADIDSCAARLSAPGIIGGAPGLSEDRAHFTRFAGLLPRRSSPAVVRAPIQAASRLADNLSQLMRR